MTHQEFPHTQADDLALYLNSKSEEASVEFYSETLENDVFATAIVFELELMLETLRGLTFAAEVDQELRAKIVSAMEKANASLIELEDGYAEKHKNATG